MSAGLTATDEQRRQREGHRDEGESKPEREEEKGIHGETFEPDPFRQIQKCMVAMLFGYVVYSYRK